MELSTEAMELSHSENKNDVSMAEELEESIPDNPPSTSDGFTSTTYEHSSSINITYSSKSSDGVSALDDEVKMGENKKRAPIMFRQTQRRNSYNQTKINELYIEEMSGLTVLNMPGDITSDGTTNPNDFYTTPDANMDKNDGNVSSTAGSKCFKTATSRALDFCDQLHVNGEKLPKKSIPVAPKTGKRHSNQSQIPYPCRKRKVQPSVAAKSPPKKHHGSGPDERIENHVNINKIEGPVIIGSNNKITCNIVYNIKKEFKHKLGEAEEVEADGTHPSTAPEKSLKVTADYNSEEFMIAFQDIINRLHPLRDNGRFEEFYKVAEDIAVSSESHIQILILIEKSMALSYQKEFAESEKAVDDAIKMISKPGVKMKNFLLAYLHVHRTGLSRRQNKLTEADEFVSTAKQNEEFIPFGITRVFIVYEHASNLTKMLSLMNAEEEEPWQIKKDDATKSLRECISLAQRIHEENSSFYLQRKQFGLVKLALLNVNCRTKSSRTQPVKDDNIHEAEHCLKLMEDNEGDMSEALSIQFYVAKSDLCFRKKDFLESKAFADQALGIAMDNNFTLEVKPIQERLKDIDRLMGLTFPET